ncbi:MAG TPA: mechanosensitive ion channel family protein [Pyrinomonadaceae bacterium]|jgi:small-conductance mechanosensitive channel/CRP-like cAMP-binding protein
MPRTHFKRQLVIFLAVTALIVVSLLLIYQFESSLRAYFTGSIAEQRMREAAEISFVNVVNIAKIILWMMLAIVIIRGINNLIFGIAFRLRKGYEAPNLVRNTFSIIAYIAIFVILFKRFYPAIDLGALFTTSAIFGVIIGLALQDTLGNLFAGISLQADKPFQVGDVITVGKWTGVVESVTWRGIKIRTFQNHVVIVSNSVAAKEAIEVCPRENLNARIVFFNTVYTDSPAKTIHIVREAVREADNVSQKIRPNVRIKDFGESSVDFEVKYWLEDYAKFNDTDALVRQRIWYAFRRAGINFAFPTRTVQLERKSRGDGQRADGSEFIDRLNAVDIFAPLSAEETARLAKNSVRRVFAPGETVIRAGDEGSSMFVVHEGRVSVQISDNGKPRTVNTLNEGDFFGEMALFTGEPRTASIVALEETEVLEIGFQAMKHLFDTNPDLVESLSHTIAERRAELKARSEDVKPDADEEEGLLAAVKRFFGIS